MKNYRDARSHSTDLPLKVILIRYMIFLIAGLGCLFLVSYFLKAWPSFMVNLSLLMAFVLLNFLFCLIFKIRPAEAFRYFSRVHYLFMALIAGVLIHSVGLLYFATTLHLSETLALKSLGGTFLIVGWEELWFRNATLLTVKRGRHLAVSLVSGLLFASMHLLNPNLNFLMDFPDIFIGGAALTFLFLHFQNIWVPIGFHWANNLTEGLYAKQPGSENFLVNYGPDFIIIVGIIWLAAKPPRGTDSGKKENSIR